MQQFLTNLMNAMTVVLDTWRVSKLVNIVVL